ncbi:MAG: hypothetical protein KY468_10555, partial [Armatimonadetes bacterium]|nr:hypothetical protein [Armatimonadota bacterium]
MDLKVLSEEQVEQFIDRGYVRLEEAFPRECAMAAQDFLWERLAERGAHKDDPSTWTEPMIHIREAYNDPVFEPCNTERLKDAIEDLVGRGRWKGRDGRVSWGWWPVNFSKGGNAPWDVPTGGWHWDGIQFRHSIDSPDQGLLLLCMFSDTGSRGGATLVAEGSHRIVARYLVDHPDSEIGPAVRACSGGHPWLSELTGITSGDTGPADIYAEGEAPANETGDRIERLMETTTVEEDGTRLRVAEAVS